MAGTAGSAGTSLAGCDGWVGAKPYPEVTAGIGQPVYIQVSDGWHIRLTASPGDNAKVEGLRVTPLRVGLTTVWVTGALCAPQPFPGGAQPKTCVLFQIDSDS